MNFFKYFLYISFAVFILSSCKKELDLKNGDAFTDDNAYLTLDDAQLGTNAAYRRYGAAYLNNMYISALLSDEAKLGAGNAGQGALTYRYQYSSDGTTGGDVNAAFPAYYLTIDQINRVLIKLPTVLTTAAEEPRRSVLKGQLLALRAMCHFELLQAYSKVYDPADKKGIAIMTVSDPLAKPARNTQGEVMAQIESDFAEAFALSPAVTAASFSDTVMNQVNINAYRARVALHKKDYQSAITYSTFVINSLVKPLATQVEFPGIWTDANTSETLIRIRYATSTAVGSIFTTTGGLIYVAPSDKLVASYSTTDIRKAAYIGTTGGNNYVNKFYTSSRGGRILDIKSARTAEMYLIRAEANAKKATPSLTAAAADLNLLRAARISGYVNETFATTSDLITAVLNERFKELAFEGFRFFDLKRNGLDVQRNASDVSASAWQTLSASSYRFVLPIPETEILANPNMVQNDGY